MSSIFGKLVQSVLFKKPKAQLPFPELPPEPENEIPEQQQDDSVLQTLPEEFYNEIKKHIKNPAQHPELIQKLKETFQASEQQLLIKNWVTPQNIQAASRRSLNISTKAHSQEGGTCYAFSTTTAVRAALNRLEGFPTPSHKRLCGDIVRKFGTNGGVVENVLKFLQDEYHFPIQWEVKYGIDKTKEILKNQINPRPFIGSFRFCGKNWDTFAKICSNQPVKIMTRDDFECKSGNCKDPDHYKAGQKLEPTGHAVVVERCQYQNGKKYWRCKNSWGENSGDKGYFLLEPDAIDFYKLIDVYFTLEHLKKPENSKYYQEPKTIKISGETYQYYETNWLSKSDCRNVYEASKSGTKFVIEEIAKYELFKDFSKYWTSVKPERKNDKTSIMKDKIFSLFFGILEAFYPFIEFWINWAEKVVNWFNIKVLKKGESEAWKSAKREIKAHYRFGEDNSENIVKFIAYAEMNNKLYIVLKHYESGSIYNKIEYGRVFPLHTTLQYLKGAAQGLADIHSKSGVHGALNADRLLIDNKICSITGFGSLTFSEDRAMEKVNMKNLRLQVEAIFSRFLWFVMVLVLAYVFPRWEGWQGWKAYLCFTVFLFCCSMMLDGYQKEIDEKREEYCEKVKKKTQELERRNKHGDKEDIYALGKIAVAMLLGEGSQNLKNKDIAGRFEADWTTAPLKNLCLLMLDENPDKRPSAKDVVSVISRLSLEGNQVFKSQIQSKLSGTKTSNFNETMSIISLASSYLYSRIVETSLSA